MKVAVFLLSLFVISCAAENDIYVGGDFLLSLHGDDDETIDHAAGIVVFDPNDNQYYNALDGGVYRKTGFLNVLQDTSLGMFGAGYFNFVGGSRDYSSSVVRYHNDDDEFEAVGGGIFLKNGQAVNFIAGNDDYTFFAGYFDTVEQLSIGQDEEVRSPSLVRVDSDYNWSNLEDPNEVFPYYPSITGLVTYEETLFVNLNDEYGNPALFNWTKDDGFILISSEEITSTIAGDGNGNIAGTTFVASGGAGGVTGGTFSLELFLIDEGYSKVSMNLYTVEGGDCTGASLEPKTIGFNSGFLVAYPNITAACTKADFSFYSVDTGAVTGSNPLIPETPGLIEFLITTDDDDDSLWLVTNSYTELYYLPFSAPQWIPVDLSGFPGFSIYTVGWDDSKEKLLVYGNTPDGKLFLEVEPVSLPPTVKEKSPGGLYTPGTVAALAVMDDPDDDDFELYIGGNFQSIGNGHDIQNFAVYKAGGFSTPLPNLPPISALATSNSTVFYATANQAQNGYPLPIGYYSKDTEDFDVWLTIPIMHGGLGFVTSIAANDHQIFVGGSFSAMLPNNAGSATGVVYFDRLTSQWGSINIPTTITSGGTANGYSIDTLSLFSYEGVKYVAIGGDFQFTIGDEEYYSFAVYNINEHSFYPASIDFTLGSTVDSVVIDAVDSVYLGGTLQLANGGNQEGVFVYDFTQNTYTQVGNLPTTARSILLHHLDDDESPSELYCSGEFKNGTLRSGLAFGPSDSAPEDTFQRAGDESQFFQFFSGSMNVMTYTSGGNGANDQNGNDPDYTPVLSSSSGMSGWGTFFLVIFILFVIVLVVGGVGAGGFVIWKKKRTTYQEV